MSRGCCVALPRDAMGLSAVCDCGISWSYSLAILEMASLHSGLNKLGSIFLNFDFIM